VPAPDESLEVVPGHQGSSKARAAPLASRSGGLAASTETYGLASAAVDRALNGYCAAFGGRLSAVSAGLGGRCQRVDYIKRQN
jgi:hypothetical protein